MKKVFCIVTLSFLTQRNYAQDYRIYHTLVNNAERCFFLEGKNDSCYHYYDSAFAKFDFAFARDCFMAAQIAYYNNSNRYIAYLQKGFKNGIRPQDLELSLILAPLVNDSIAFKKKFPEYLAFRKAYLKRINVNLLRKIIEITAKDQSQKYHPDKEYGPTLYNNILTIRGYAASAIGFPGEKIIGISQTDIMHELGFDKQDYPDYPWGKANFQDCYEYLSQCNLETMLVHHPCSWHILEKYWDKAIIAGQVHPRQVALFHDYEYGNIYHEKVYYNCFYDRPWGSYKISQMVDYSIINYNRHTIDSMRTSLFINILAVDSAKESYEIKHAFKSIFGCFECKYLPSTTKN